MHYGKVMVSYLPFRNSDDFEQYIVTPTVESNVIFSQRQHIVLDPNTAKGGVIVLPYLYPFPKISLPSADYANMGTLTVSSLTTLRHANAASENVEITCHIWAEEVQVSVPTQANIGGLTAQSGEITESDGPISRAATVIEHMAGALQDVPAISPYALATTHVASQVASTARSFGYSRPAYTEQITPFITRSMPNVANVNVHDTVQKVSLDCRQETTIDTRTDRKSVV